MESRLLSNLLKVAISLLIPAKGCILFYSFSWECTLKNKIALSFSHSWHYNVLFLAFQCIPLGLEFQILYSTLGLIITFLPTNKLILCLRCICSSCHTCQRISYKTVKAVISARGHGSFKKSYFYVPRIGYWAESAGARSLR